MFENDYLWGKTPACRLSAKEKREAEFAHTAGPSAQVTDYHLRGRDGVMITLFRKNKTGERISPEALRDAQRLFTKMLPEGFVISFNDDMSFLLRHESDMDVIYEADGGVFGKMVSMAQMQKYVKSSCTALLEEII